MAGIYNNNNSPIPGNGADFFGDKLVGNQFVDGSSQFTLGNFEIKSNVNQKDSRSFSLGNFSEPISLETLNIKSSEEARILASNRLEVFIKYSRSKITNFTLYGSLRERLKVAVNNVIKQFPAALVFKKIRDWSDYNSGNTATNISFNASTNKTNISLHLYNVFNPFSIEYTQVGNLYTDENISSLRNLSIEYKKYSLYYKNVEYPLTFLTPTTGNTSIGNLNIVVEGNPFSGASVTTDSFYLKPNTLTTEEVFDKMEDVEKYLVERTTNPLYTATFDQPRETSTGKIVKSSVSVTWPSTDNWNLIINGGLFESYLAKLYDIADTYDSYKTNLVSRFLTTAALKEFDTYDEKVDKILKIYGRSFDEIKKYIDGLAYMANTTYDGINNIPNELLKNFAQTLGWGTPSAIKSEGFLDTIFKRSTAVEYGGLAQNQTPTELNYELYRRLLANTAYLFKSKGTRRGIEFMLRFVGAPEALIEFNEHVYVAGQPLNMREFRNYELKISGGTYTEEVPVLNTYFSAATNNTFPAVVITGYTFGYETITKSTNIIPEVLPVDKDGYPTVPRYGADSYFQSGAGWFEETTEHQGKKVIDYENSVFTGNTPFVRTKLNQFSYGEPYLELYRKFPDSKLGFPIVRTVDNKKSWVRKNSYQQRYLNLPDRGTNYQTQNDKLVINVKNVDIFLNIGQGLEWDVWNFSKKYSCPFGPNALGSPYPGVGGPDWTEIIADASKLSFFEFAQKFWTVLINVKNRQTIDDGHAGGYPTLLSIYLDYLKSDQTCGIPSNKYTYEKMIAYVENMGDYWVRLLEQLVPSTTIWQGGIKYENSIFHRYKYAYKHEPLCDDLECFGSFVHCCYPIANDILVDATLECGGLAFSGATWQNKITLGGTVYTGNTYYSSTTITDIPSTDIWLDDMVEILSGITTNVTDPNHTLSYYLINDNNTPTGLQIDQPNCIVIQGPCGTGQEVCDCPPGYEYDAVSELCLAYTASTTTTGTTINKAAGNSGYNQYGARFCVPGSYTTCGSGAPASNFKVIGGASNPFWDANGTTTQGRLNNVGVNNADMLTSDHFFGFSRCIDVPVKGEYLFALAGDDEIRANLNGVQIVNNPWNGTMNANNFRYWWVWPVTLNAGQNTLTLEGANGFSGGPASFGCEIVGPFAEGTFTVNTDFDIFSAQTGIDTYTANTIFSSLNEVGNTFNTQTNVCPSGYTYDVCSDSCVKTTEPGCITYPDGEDVWNFNSGSDPHCFKSEICLTLQTTQVNPVPNGTDIWAFYDTTSTGTDMANAAKTSLDSWVSSLGTSFTGNTYHIPVGGERWLSWASSPISGGTLPITNTYGAGFNVLPSGMVGNTVPVGVSPNVLSIYFIDESQSIYHGYAAQNSCGYYAPSGNIVTDWSNQPTVAYSGDFTTFMSAFNAYDDFKGFIYPIVKDGNAARLAFPLHVYGALETSTVAISDLIENPTVTAAGGTLSAITITNPYTGLTGTNVDTGYTGPGLENFGFGANYTLGTDSCGGLTCTDPGFQASCLTSDASRFFDGTFQQDLFTFLQGSSDVTLKDCEICIPICYREETETQEWSKSKPYNYGDIVLWQGQLWVWLGFDNTYTNRPDVSKAWSLRGAADCIPFLGGNDFRPHDDCDDFTVIPENPEVTGTTITTNPEIFKESIFNVGGQDCFDSTYNPCEELTDPCGCSATFGQFDETTVLFAVGDVVCCPGDPDTPPTKWIRVDGGTSCNTLELFIPALCGSTPPQNKCWRLCEPETEGEGATSGGFWGKETVRRRRPSLISNSPTDPCDPSYENPTDPCDCQGIGFRNVDLDFYLLNGIAGVPDSIMEFFMEEDAIDPANWTQPINSITTDPKVYKAQINACCLGDKFTHYFRVYHRTGNIPSDPSQITYGEYEIDFDMNQNCNIEFYHVEAGDTVKMFMHIPSSTLTNNATISIIDNPLLGIPYLTQNLGASNYFNNTNGNGLQSLTFQIGKIDTTSNIHQFFKVDDSNYLTDNGTNSTNEETNDIFDRYWALDPFLGQQPLYGALTPIELLNITGNHGDSPGFLGVGNYRFNWEMELSCEGQQTLELSFTLNSFSPLPSGGAGNINKEPGAIIGTPLQPGVGGSNQLIGATTTQPVVISKPSIQVPFTKNVCGTDMSSPIINQNESANGKVESISRIQTSGNLTDIPVAKSLTDVNSDINIKNYTITNSEMYIVSNFNPLKNNRVVEYNSPVLSRNLKNGLTYGTFTENGRERAKLSWLDNFTKNGKTKINIEFASDENKKRFEQDLKLKNVGQGVEFLPGRNKSNTTITETVGKTQFIDLRDWATRSLGEVKDFSNSSIVYGNDGLLKRFEIGPTFTTEIANSQYKIGTAPIGDPHTEFIISTMGSLEDYLSYQTGTTSSALTITLTGVSTLYSGYTNLSGYTDNEGLNLSPDFVFDLSLNENNISYTTGVPFSDPTFSERREVSGVISRDFKLLGDERRLRPVIPMKTLSEDNQLFFLPREEVSTSGDYFYYKVPKTQNYRLQYKSCIYFDYFDEGWCTYLDTFRTQSNNLFPVNDYDFIQLINSSIVYAGGELSAPYQYKEGNIINDTYNRLGVTGTSMSPIFGYNAGNGIKDFKVNIYIERLLSGTTATTVIGDYVIGSNPTDYPNANEHLLLPVNDSDKFTDLYQCTGMTATTKVFNKKFTPYIDTGCVQLNKDDEIRLRINIEWENTTKNNTIGISSGLTASTISLKVGTDYSESIPKRPWFRVINKECNVPETTTYLYWQANETGPVSTQLYSKGETIQPTQGSEVGRLVFTDTKDNLDYVTPNIRVNNLQNLTYFDLPNETDYQGNLKLIETQNKTNNWVRQLENNEIKDFKINSGKILNVENNMEVKWNVPVPTRNNVDSISLDDPRFTFLIESNVKVKGTLNEFKILNTVKPDFKSDTTKEEIVDVETLINPNNITYTSSRPLEERTIGFDDNRTIIREKIVAVESVIYDKNTPTADKERTQYCKCGDSSFIPVPYNSTVGCDQWCCVNSYEKSTYYPCREKTINQWANGLNLKTVIVPNPTNGIIRGL